MKLWTRNTLFRQVLCLVWAILILSISIPTALNIRGQRELLERKLLEHGVAITESITVLAEAPLRSRDDHALHELVFNLARDDPQVAEALLVNKEGTVIAHSDRRYTGTILSDLLSPPSDTRMLKTTDTQGSTFLRVTSPVLVDGVPTGAVQTGLPLKVLEIELRAMTRQTLITGAFIAAMATLAAAWLARTITRPIARLARLANRVAAGDFDVRSESRSSNEIGQLSMAFNEMAGSLAVAKQELETYSSTLELTVEERTDALCEQAVELLRAKEEAEEANRFQSTFLANMSHELRTPLHAVLSYSTFGMTRMESEPRDRLMHFFRGINNSATTLKLLLDDLLDLAKLEAGRMEYQMVLQDLKSVVENARVEFEPTIESKQLTLKIDPTSCTTRAVFDAFRIAQVVRNILSNAVKFTESRRSITISFRENPLTRDGIDVRGVELAVADEGAGIPDDELESVFDKFTQSSRTKTGSGGTGLGLAICREIIAAHNGWIRATGNPGGGTIMTFWVPLEHSLSGIDSATVEAGETAPEPADGEKAIVQFASEE